MMIDINNIANKEEKIKIARKIVENVKNNQVIGFGSGTTSYLAAIEIGKYVRENNLSITAVPTSNAIEEICNKYDIKIGKLSENTLDWAFDGADEVDEDSNMIKGKGRALFREKLNLLNSKENFILVDKTKLVKKLGEKDFVPIEVYPDAIRYVKEELKKLNALEFNTIGETENNNTLIEAKFENIEFDMEKKIKLIPGVIESGLFMGYNVKVITN